MALPSMEVDELADRAEDPATVHALPEKFVEGLIRQAITRIETRSPTRVAARLASGALDDDAYKDVIARVVMRIVRNPEGYVSETEGTYTYQLRAATGSGVLQVTDDDLIDLTGAKARMTRGTLHVGTHGR